MRESEGELSVLVGCTNGHSLPGQAGSKVGQLNLHGLHELTRAGSVRQQSKALDLGLYAFQELQQRVNVRVGMSTDGLDGTYLTHHPH